MNKKKLNGRKLALSKETVRRLGEADMSKVAGAMTALTFGTACPSANCMTLGELCPTHDCTLTFGPCNVTITVCF